MIKRCSIENFKTLETCNINNLKRINLLGGKNNTGKSTLMEALFLYFDRMNPEVLLRQYSWRGIISGAVNSFDVFSPIFYEYNTSKKIKIEIGDSEHNVERLSIECKENTKSTISLNEMKMQNFQNDSKAFNNDILEMNVKFEGPKKSKFKQQKIIHTINGNNMEIKVENAHLSTIQNAVFLAAKVPLHSSENAIRYGELVKKNTEKDVLEFLKIIEPRLNSISIVPLTNNTSMLYGDIGLDVKIPLNYMGDGINRILSILLSIVSTPNGTVFIDEIENGIHHSVLQEVWGILDQASKKYNCQIFATTHSYECLAAMVEGLEGSKEDVNYIRLEKQDNEVQAKEYDYDMLTIAIEQGWEVR